MVGWRNATQSVATFSDFTATASNVIGFHRGSLGWIGINGSGSASTATYPTGLADGTYCDVITGGAHHLGDQRQPHGHHRHHRGHLQQLERRQRERHLGHLQRVRDDNHRD